jgi:uncharacterized membrane protein YccC
VPPWLLLALLIALVVALLYQLATKRYGWRVVLYWVVIALAMLLAEAGAEALGWNFTRFGDLRLLPDLVGAALVVVLLWFLGV